MPQRSRGQAWKWGIVLVLPSLWLESAVGLDPIIKGIWEESLAGWSGGKRNW